MKHLLCLLLITPWMSVAQLPPILRGNITTNLLSTSAADGWFLVSSNSKPFWSKNGGALTNITGVAVAQGTNIITTTNGSVVTVNGITDTNVIRTLAISYTNNDTVVSNGAIAFAALTTNRTTLYVDGTNVLNPVLTTATSTNTATVYSGGADFFLVSATPCAITNVVGATAGYLYSVDCTISNSTASAFTNFMNLMAGKPRGYIATNSAAVLGFNGAVVPASAELFVHIETRGVNETNYWLSY